MWGGFVEMCGWHMHPKGLSAARVSSMGDRPFGAGRRGGASQEIAEVLAVARLKPHDVLVSLAVSNAFGSVQWADALRVTSKGVPRLTPFIAIK